MSFSDNIYLERIANTLEKIRGQNAEIADHLSSIRYALSWTPDSSIGLLDDRLDSVQQQLIDMEASMLLEIAKCHEG